MPATSNYWVYDTDYEKYSVVYNCVNLPLNMKKESLWVLSRLPLLSNDVTTKVEAIIDENFDRKANVFVKTVQGEQ